MGLKSCSSYNDFQSDLVLLGRLDGATDWLMVSAVA